jgi:hypothetical protein
MTCFHAYPAFCVFAAILFLDTAKGDDAAIRELPAVQQVLEKAQASVGRNRKAFEDANAKVFKELEKSLEEESQKLSKAGKSKEAEAVKSLLRAIEGELVIDDDQARSKKRKPSVPAMAGATQWNGHRYKVFPDPVSWSEARKACEDVGGHLVIIEDQKEHDSLMQWVKIPGDPGYLWIGTSDQAREGRWLWVNGTPVVFKKFAPGEPTNSVGKEHYAVMNFANGGLWNDLPDDIRCGFICEWDE